MWKFLKEVYQAYKANEREAKEEALKKRELRKQKSKSES